MKRLLQGDVGSGKTLVSFFMYVNGMQLIMDFKLYYGPTEILAMQ